MIQLPDFMYEKPDHLQIAIDEALATLKGVSPDSTEYAAKVDQIVRLQKMKEQNAPSRLSPDTLVLSLTNLLGIGLIIRHERFNVVTSKALGFVLKSR